jgi:hypothetical protein
MKSRKIVMVGMAVVIVGILLFSFRPGGSQSPPQKVTLAGPPWPSEEQETGLKRAASIVQGVYDSPIEFYGKVQDHRGNPVSHAAVKYSALDKFMQPGTKYEGVSDGNGLFSLTGVNGAGLLVHVSKDGYDRIKDQSSQSFGYGMPSDNNRKAPPTKDRPALFVLRTKAEAEPMLFSSSRQIKVPNDRSVLALNLETGATVPFENGDLLIERYTDDQEKDAEKRFDWWVRLRVPNGGLIERDPQFSFIAPEEGYQEVLELNMPKSLGDKWENSHEGDYFLKLGNGRFARISLKIRPTFNNFLLLESYINPSGSRNLEYDPAKRVYP